MIKIEKLEDFNILKTLIDKIYEIDDKEKGVDDKIQGFCLCSKRR